MPSKPFPALPGLYQTLFMYIEPASTVAPVVMIFLVPGATWFHHQLIPSETPAPPSGFLDPRTDMALLQLANCYGLLGLISCLVFRAARDALSSDLVGQERVTGALLTALAVGDIAHIVASFIGLPSDLRLNPMAWNGMTHGNITVIIGLFIVRMMWFTGTGRTRYYYGKNTKGRTA